MHRPEYEALRTRLLLEGWEGKHKTKPSKHLITMMNCYVLKKVSRTQDGGMVEQQSDAPTSEKCSHLPV